MREVNFLDGIERLKTKVHLNYGSLVNDPSL